MIILISMNYELLFLFSNFLAKLLRKKNINRETAAIIADSQGDPPALNFDKASYIKNPLKTRYTYWVYFR
jgi:hypothetical protein